MWYLFLWLVFPFTVFPYIVILCWVALATYFPPLILLHCYSQVASIFRLISDYFVELSLPSCLSSIATKKLLLKPVVPQLRSWILLVTRKDFPQVHCIAPSVPVFPKSPELKWITTLPGNFLKPLRGLFKNAKKNWRRLSQLLQFART